ncbi:MAG: DUF3997 domain-containing protein [Clostridiales bacterium]|nr:DUF3997 domain-containing protein [Clostridiales bacterium]
MLVCCLTSCGPGLNDWTYDLLPGDYEVWHVNSNTIDLGKRHGNSLTTMIDRYVLAFCYNDVMIGVQQIVIDEDPQGRVLDMNQVDKSHPDYYLIDAETDTVYGPYSAEEYESQVEALEATDMCDWILTVPRPDGAKS